VVRLAEIVSLEESERDAILEALTVSGGNRSRAARALGISRQTLYTKLSKYRIGRADAA
jgi:transcriptional regulator of acetoin/glycerol metabolism